MTVEISDVSVLVLNDDVMISLPSRLVVDVEPDVSAVRVCDDVDVVGDWIVRVLLSNDDVLVLSAVVVISLHPISKVEVDMSLDKVPVIVGSWIRSVEEMDDVCGISELVEIDCSVSEVGDEVGVSDIVIVGVDAVVSSTSELVVATPVSDSVMKSVCVSVMMSTI